MALCDTESLRPPVTGLKYIGDGKGEPRLVPEPWGCSSDKGVLGAWCTGVSMGESLMVETRDGLVMLLMGLASLTFAGRYAGGSLQ